MPYSIQVGQNFDHASRQSDLEATATEIFPACNPARVGPLSPGSWSSCQLVLTMRAF